MNQSAYYLKPKAFIYGSYAREEENLLSDIDLMVIGDISSKELSNLLSKPKKEMMQKTLNAINDIFRDLN